MGTDNSVIIAGQWFAKGTVPMMKDLTRTIMRSKGRFFAIAAICAIGVGFFGGLQMTCGDMKQAATTFFNNTNMMDIRVLCNLGLSQENIESIKKVEDVDAVMSAYESDILTNFGNEQCAIRIHSLCSSAKSSQSIDGKIAESDDDNYINRPILTQGEWPKVAGECVLLQDAVIANPPKLGDEIDVIECSTGADYTFSVKKLKVVGYVRSSYYFNTVQLGASNLGRGIINQVAYVNEDTFSKDYPYSEVFITVNKARNFVTGSDEYQQCIDDVMTNIALIAPDQSEIRTASVKSSAQNKLDEAKNEYQNQKQSAMDQLDENEKKLNEAYDEISSGSTLISAIEKTISDGYVEFYRKKDEIFGQIEAAKQAILGVWNAESEIKTSNSTNASDIEKSMNKVIEYKTVSQGLAEVLSLCEKAKIISSYSITVLQNIIYDPEKLQIAVQLFNNKIDNLNKISSDTQNFISKLESAKTESERQEIYSSMIYSYYWSYLLYHWTVDAGIDNFFTTFEKEIQESYNEILSIENQATESFNEKKSQLDSAADELRSAKDKLYIGSKEYYDAIAKFNQAKNDALQSLSNAETQLSNSQDEINNIENARFYILDRTKNFTAINFNNDAERIASIANVFPLIFFFVAILVVLTSMTRMVEEERITIGTYKALGFSRLGISNKYILYGLVSSLIGCIIGLVVLTQFLPWVIMFAYSIMYKLPIPFPMPFNLTIGFISILLGVGLTVLVTFLTVIKSLRQVPALLMIPTAPKSGKRILLEYIKPFWKILSFNWKISLRNMFLYKKRLFMTVIGIAGCTALLLTGFGLHDSISDILDKQFSDIMYDNLKISLSNSINSDQEKQISDVLKSYDNSSQYTLVHEENVVAQPKGHPNATTTIVVPKDVDSFQNMRVLKNRVSGQSFVIDSEGIYISEKLANMMQVDAGDDIEVYEQDLIGNAGDKKYQFKIAGIVENYIAHYIYMSSDLYKQYFNKECNYNNVISKIDTNGFNQTLINNLRENSTVKTAFFTDSNRNTYETMLGSVNMVVVILIVSAGALAFVVLYNLININICERAREIATLKVLGSKRGELFAYIHRETIMLSVFGSLIGIALGFLMEHFVIISAEVDYVMFGRNIYWWSIAISLCITLGFTLLVILFMRHKLYDISMVESLKSE